MGIVTLLGDKSQEATVLAQVRHANVVEKWSIVIQGRKEALMVATCRLSQLVQGQTTLLSVSTTDLTDVKGMLGVGGLSFIPPF